MDGGWLMPDENTYYWLYNEDMDNFFRYKVNGEEKVSIVEYEIQKKKNTRTVKEAGCPIVPNGGADHDDLSIEDAQKIWMYRVTQGYRMMVDTFGRIEHQAGMTTCWITLNSTRKVNYS